MEADAALRGLRLEVGRLVAQQQTRHGCDYCSDSRSLPWPPPTLRMRGATAPTPPLGRRGPAGCHVTGGRRALRLPPHFAALCGGGEGGGGAPPCPALLPSSLSGGVGDGDVRERAGGGQEEPERGAGREREAVSAAGWGGVRRGEARPIRGGGVPPGWAGPERAALAGPGCCGARVPCLCGSLSAGLAPGCFALVGGSSGFRNNAFRLVSALSPLLPRYWANLKLWFKQKISKEEFDLEARRLLTQDNGK